MGLTEACILLLQFRLFFQGLFPLPGQLAGHQSILRFDGSIVALSAFSLIARPLQPLAPILVQSLTLLVKIISGQQT